MKFTKQSLANLALPEGKIDAIFFDGTLPGFGVRLRAGGKAVWIIQYRVGHHQRRETLGDIRKITLDAARSAARRRFAQVMLGADPAAEKAEAKQRNKLTLGSLTAQYLDFKQPLLRPSTHSADRRYLTTHWKPLHDLPVHLIKRRNVAATLNEIIAQNGKVAAARARGSLSAFFVWAVSEGLAEENPTIGTNNPAAGIEPRARVLKAGELRAIWRACAEDDFGRITRLLMLLGTRRDEIGGLRWDEFDLDVGMLTIPGTRTKNHHPLVLPLAPTALDILRSAPCREGRDFVFGGRGGGFSSWSYSTIALGVRITAAEGAPLAPWTLHDIRRSVATHLAELGVLPHVVETILNHRSGHKAGVGGVYNRAVYEREVRAALLMWADHLQSIVEGTDHKVVPLRPKEVPG